MTADIIGISVDNVYLSREIIRKHEDIVRSLALIIECKCPLTLKHSRRISQMANFFSNGLGLSKKETKIISEAGLLHDIGKIYIDNDILNKKGKLEESEYIIVKKHPEYSYEILAEFNTLKLAAQISRYHHERYDGKGYPYGIAKEEIPLGARMLSIIDAFEAMIGERPYRASLSVPAAIRELQENAGGQFDPELVQEFIKLVQNKQLQIFSV